MKYTGENTEAHSEKLDMSAQNWRETYNYQFDNSMLYSRRYKIQLNYHEDRYIFKWRNVE